MASSSRPRAPIFLIQPSIGLLIGSFHALPTRALEFSLQSLERWFINWKNTSSVQGEPRYIQRRIQQEISFNLQTKHLQILGSNTHPAEQVPVPPYVQPTATH